MVSLDESNTPEHRDDDSVIDTGLNGLFAAKILSGSYRLYCLLLFGSHKNAISICFYCPNKITDLNLNCQTQSGLPVLR